MRNLRTRRVAVAARDTDTVAKGLSYVESRKPGERGRRQRIDRWVSRVSTALPLDERRVVAWVGKSVIFIGSLISSEDMTIDGHVEGSIEVLDQALTVGPDADIRADIMARVVTIHGTVTATFARAPRSISARRPASTEIWSLHLS